MGRTATMTMTTIMITNTVDPAAKALKSGFLGVAFSGYFQQAGASPYLF